MKLNTKGNEPDGVYKTYKHLTIRNALWDGFSMFFPIMSPDLLPNEVNQGYRSFRVLQAFIKCFITMFYCHHVVHI